MNQIASSSVGTPGLDRDLFCLQCGYNLRGLAGDPIRCPECGYHNDLGIASIPADLIRTTLHEMETYPTWCVVMSLGLLVMLIPAATGHPTALLLAGLGVGGCVLGWRTCYGAATRVYPQRDFLRRLLFDFHAIVGLCLVPFVVVPVIFTFIRVRNSGVVVLVFLGSLIACWVMGIRWYGRVRGRLAEGQRETAVRIARSCLQNWRWRH